jgi:lipopolysaccharide transport system permease protein
LNTPLPLSRAPGLLLAIPLTLWNHRTLIWRLVAREIAARYRGSIFGLAWALLSPIVMLTIYTFVFTVVFQARWQADLGDRADFALNLFTGLIVFQFFNESMVRAPQLLLENVALIKKVVFPLECLAWVAVGSAGFGVLMNMVVLLAASVLLAGIPPVTALLFPVIMMPLVLLTVGLVWFLSATGVYLRDLGQVVAVVMPMLLFSSAVFFPLTAIPLPYRDWLALNPLVLIIETSREVLLTGTVPGIVTWGLLMVLSAAVAGLGLAWFRTTRRGFADVV